MKQKKIIPQHEEDIEVEVSVQRKLRRDGSASALFAASLPDPPSTVFAIGRHESAEIWWTRDYGLDEGQDIVAWEITRYRKDKKNKNPTWSPKGCMTILQMGKIHQCVYHGLKSQCEYRFTVTVKTADGYSLESRPSNTVYVDYPPPVGWKLCHDRSTRQYYYCNEYFDVSTLKRPDQDPYFIEHHVAKLFSKHELRSFKELWIEEIMHFQVMTFERFKNIMFELGEEVNSIVVRDHFKAYAKSETEVKTFKDFMDIVWHLKIDMKSRKPLLKNDKAKSPKSYSIGKWQAEYHKYSKRWQYINESEIFGITRTWDMPWEVRFHMSEEDSYDVHTHFDFGMVERIRMQFDVVNVSKSGLVSLEELNMFLVAVDAVTAHHNDKLGLQLSSMDRMNTESFFRKVDINRSGYITFNEFCLLLCQLKQGKCSGILGKIQKTEYLKTLASSGPVKVPMAPSIHLKMLQKKAEKASLLKRIAKQKSKEEKSAPVVDKSRNRASKRSKRKNQYAYDESSDRHDLILKQSSCSEYMGTIKDDEVLDELRAIAPPKLPKWLAFMSLFTCCCSELIHAEVESLKVSRANGAHGMYCLCGCRGNNVTARDPYF